MHPEFSTMPLGSVVTRQDSEAQCPVGRWFGNNVLGNAHSGWTHML